MTGDAKTIGGPSLSCRPWEIGLPHGSLGSGHAAKALNNYVSAAGRLLPPVVAIAEGFGIDPNILVDVLNASTGRNNSSDNKLKQFIISGKFNSGFSLALMAKDIRTADDLAHQLDVPAPLADEVAAQWEDALKVLGSSADHTEIGRYSTASAEHSMGCDEIFERLVAALAVREAKVFERVVRPFSGGDRSSLV